MTISAVFKSHIPSVQYFFKNGKQAAFLMGKYITSIDSEIKELTEEVGDIGVSKSKHPHIYVDEAESTIDSEALTPIELIRQEAYEKAKADLIASGTYNATKASTSSQAPAATSFANTVNIAEATEGGGSTQFVDVSVPATATPAVTPAVTPAAEDIAAKLAALKTK